MKHYSWVILQRIGWLAFWLISIIAVAAWWFNHLQTTTPSAAGSDGRLYYRPQKRIEQIDDLQQVFKNHLNEVKTLANTSLSSDYSMGCNERGKAVILMRTMDRLGLQQSEAASLLHRLEAEAPTRMSCTAWIDTLQRIYKYHTQTTANSANGSDQSLQAALSENVSWSLEVPCLYARHIGGMHLVSGLNLQCPQIGQPAPTVAKTRQDTQSFTESLSRSFLQNASRQTINQLRGQSQLITLDPTVQLLLNDWKNCFSRTGCKLSAQQRTLKHVSVVVSDVATGEVLGVLCWGGPCNNASLKPWGDLAALMVEAPPASTIKLLHALALARHPETDTVMLQRQIKSSGQTDASVTKRNEWWEKQAICNRGERTTQCAHPMEVAELAKVMGWNRHCVPASIQCGRQSLIAGVDDLLMPGLIGRLDLGSAAKKPVTMIDWQTYDAVRNNRQKSDGSLQYLHTSNAVQSVIGAGNARVSPLGLAHLTMQIKRRAAGLGLADSVLIRPLHTPQNNAMPTAAEVKAASVVLQGMRMVMQKQEADWKDPGTMSAHLERRFGQPCQNDCGLWGKTGTVSSKDPHFAGASLFAGLVETDRLSQWMKSETQKPARTLAIGLIAVPSPNMTPFHDAGALSMELVHALVTEKP